MISFMQRNLKVFFRDRSAVFFSLLASLIIIGIYVLFLGEVYASNLSSIENSREIMDNWIMAGLLATTSVTTTMGAFGIMVDDKAKKINKDFYVSPISKYKLAGGYLFSALMIGFILSLITFVFAELYIVLNGGSLIAAASLPAFIGTLMLTVIANAAMVFFITSFFSSNNAFSTASTIIGTIIGFLTGIYLPVGQLPQAVQWIVKLFPTSHAAVLLRQIMMNTPLTTGFNGIPANYLADFKEEMGILFIIGDNTVSNATSIVFLLATALIFFALTAFNLSRKTS
ncbi:MAG: multidrug/hemolysin transport system permease protein [Clostridiales bacterium]|jgi:multidrug/hemolysin transport system permease protein|nr:multidrug/hemolysin transport system permease protein [Clostridiales bacterium]MDN5297627.1 multidrug/hemolysin transport system permease protein [Clostridiales bacterium]